MALRKVQRVYPRSSEDPFQDDWSRTFWKRRWMTRDITMQRRSQFPASCRRANGSRLTDDLLIGIRKMSERGDTIIATVVALE